MPDCFICKKHYSQGGGCCTSRKNCGAFEEEPRGRMLRTSLTFKIDSNADTSIIKPGGKIIFDDNGQSAEMQVVKINWIDLKKMSCNVDADYHENDMPRFEKKKRFKVLS